MRHGEVRLHLDEFASGELSHDLHDVVEAHAENCHVCKEWLTTHRSLKQRFKETPHHPAAGMIATYVVEPATLIPSARAAMAQHLDKCIECGADFELAARALEEARCDSPTSDKEVVYTRRNWRPMITRLGIAATLILTIVLVTRSANPPSSATDETLANVTLGGVQVVEASGRLVATHVEVAETAQLALRATNSVALGEGFSVKRGAKLVVGTERVSNGS